MYDRPFQDSHPRDIGMRTRAGMRASTRISAMGQAPPRRSDRTTIFGRQLGPLGRFLSRPGKNPFAYSYRAGPHGKLNWRGRNTQKRMPVCFCWGVSADRGRCPNGRS
eukprot:880041-Pyramimonas_sp.AAC.1